VAACHAVNPDFAADSREEAGFRTVSFVPTAADYHAQIYLGQSRERGGPTAFPLGYKRMKFPQKIDYI
jgi:hypothetical protein